MYHLTKPQKLIYDMEKYAGGSIAVVCGSIIIKGQKDISALASAVNELFRLNDALRIRIIEKDGIPYQVVTEYAEQEINVLCVKDKVELNLYAEKYAKEPMDFYGSLCDINIFILDEAYGILVKLHHIISDAWTLALIGSQFNALANGRTPETYSYLDYISAEQNYLNGKRYPKDREYYIEQYKKCDEVTYISDKQIQSYTANRKHFLIDCDKTAKIANYAKEHNTSVYMLLMTALGVYINRIKINREKFHIGTAMLNRANVQEKNTMGMFINTAPVLFELDNEKTFKENLDMVSQNLFSVIKHQKFNYGDVLETLRGEFDFTGNLYDVMLSYQNAKFTGIDTEFESTWYHCGMQTESLQIHIDDRDSEGVLKIHYDYQTEKFTEKEIERMNKHLFNLIFDAIDEDKKIIDLSILSGEEKNTLLYDFNNTKADYPKDKCVHQLFEEQVLKAPNKNALKFGDKAFTYQEINSMSNDLAIELRKMGIGRNDIVALVSKRSYHLVVAIFGILKAGGAYLPIDYNYPQDRINYIIDDAKCKAIVTFEVDIDRDNVVKLQNIFDFNRENLECINTPNDLCAVIYTSGSTGKPKGSLMLHKGAVNFAYANDALYKGGSCILGFSTYTFDAFFAETIPALVRGSTIILSTEDEQFNQTDFENLIKKNPKANCFITPAKLKQFIDNSDNVSFIKDINKICIGGEIFPIELLKFFSEKTQVFNVYGPSECSVWMLEYLIENEMTDGGFVMKKYDISLGKPIANTQVYILDKYNKLVPIGVTGELCIAGDGVGAGYLNRPELTAEKFVDNPLGEGKMYKTGDLAYWREDGNIAYVGRNDFQVKIRGLRIELGEIENAICSTDGISQAVVVVRKDESGRQLICAFYTEKSAVDVTDIKKTILDRLPKYMLPHIFTVLPEMPLTPSGKINRKALPEVDLANISNDVEYVKPQTKLQKEIAGLMEKVLNYSPIGLEEDFFDLGGDSLKAIEFVSKAHNEGIYFDLQAVFDNPTVKTLCEYIEGGNRQKISFAEMDFTKADAVLTKNTIDNISVPQKTEVGNALFAGVTGYLGMHVLSDFLDNDEGVAYCLVRGTDKQVSKDRFYNLLEYYFGDKYADNDRIVVLCGDLQKENFGLTDDEYSRLLNDVNTVINTAASVKHYGSYKYFYEANVETVNNLIAFCKKTDARLIHTSTLSVSGNSFGDEFDGYISETEKHFFESSLYIEQPLDNVYARSKFEAEKAVLDAIADGLKANIMRMGNLTNRYSDAKFQKNYESNTFLKHVKGILDLGIFPDYLMHIYIEFTPIDDAANAVMQLARHFSTEQTVFHINSTKVVYMDRLLEYFSKCGMDMQVVNGTKFTEVLRNTAKQSGTEYIFETFINDMDENDKLNYDSNIHIENDFTVEYLKQLGFEWSDINFEYIKRYIEYFREIGYLTK